jgi:ABC-type transporter Mla subunit MlaD
VALAAALLFAFPPSWLDRRHDAIAVFSNLGSLGEGADVRENGFVVGNVAAIEPLGGLYRVHMKLKPDWRMASGGALAVDQTNPLQPAILAIAHVCKVAATAEKPAAGCCPDKPLVPDAVDGEIALVSCGRTPNLIDVALATTVKASDAITSLQAAMPSLMAKTTGAITATAGAMVAMKAVSDKTLLIVDDTNRENLKNALASFSGSGKTINELLAAKQVELESSITSLNAVLQQAAAKLPAIMDNMQKSSEDLRAISAQIRNQPTSLLRKRDRSDPDFVEPPSDKN